MRLFECANCHEPIYFENNRCLACQTDVGYHVWQNAMSMVAADGPLA